MNQNSVVVAYRHTTSLDALWTTVSKSVLRLTTVVGVVGLISVTAGAQNTPTTPVPSPTTNVNVTTTESSSPNPQQSTTKSEVKKSADSGKATETVTYKRTTTTPATAKTGKDSGTRAIKGGGGKGATATGGGKSYEPALKNPVDYGDPPPEGGEVISNPKSKGVVAVTELLDALALATGWNVVTTPKIEEKKVRYWLNKVTPQQALEVLRFNGIYYHYSKDTKYLYVSTVDEYLEGEYGEQKEFDFAIKHADVTDMETILTSLLSPGGRIISDPRTAHILVWDTKDNLEQMKKTVARLDVELTPKVFQLKYVNADALLESIQSMLTERGLAQADPRANSLIVTDLPGRVEQISQMVTALDKKLDTHTWTLNYVDPKEIAERIENLVPEEMGSISMDKERHQLSVTAIPARIEEIGELIKTWDVKPLQVQIEAYLVSAGVTVARNLGIDWSYFGDHNGKPFAVQIGPNTPDYSSQPGESGQRLTLGSLPYQVPSFYPLTTKPIVNIAGKIANPEFKGNQLGAVLDYLDTHGDIRVLSRPRVTVRDGEQATFENTEDRPYQQGGYSQYGGTSTTTDPNFNRVIPLQVEFIKVGTVLKVKPRVNTEGNIVMEISAEDSSADNVTVTTGDQKSTVPQKRQNKAVTTVLSHDGETIVIGGMRASSVNDTLDKVPVFGDVPFLGRLFKNTKKDHQDRELMIFITATIVDEYTRAEASRLTGVESGITDTIRNSEKPLLERMQSDLTKNKNEIGVSIGQGGAIYSQGEAKTMDELKEDFAKVKNPKAVKVILRCHPEAPATLKEQVSQLAKDAGLKVVVDDRAAPFVANLPAANSAQKK